MKISVDAEELIDHSVLEQAAEKYCSQYGVTSEELARRMREEPQLSLYVSEDDAIRWGIVSSHPELF